MATPQHPDIRRSLSPSPKRRRISHSHSHAHAHSPPRLAASSTVATGISGTPRRTPNNSPGRSPHRRASYLSPTKASLARFNPSLLPKSPLKDAPALKPTREDTAQVVPPRLGISTSRGKKVLAYVLGKSDEASEEGAPQRKQKPDYPMTDQSERDSQSATPGSRLQNVVNAVISDLEQTRTPEIPRQFAAIPFGGDDDDHLLPDTPSGVRYEPPRGIFSSGAGRVGRKKPLKEKIVENNTSRTNHERPQVQQLTTHRSEPTVVQPLVTGDARTENADDDEAAVEVRDKKRKIDALQEEVNKTKEDIEMWAKYFNDDDNNGDDKELMYGPDFFFLKTGTFCTDNKLQRSHRRASRRSLKIGCATTLRAPRNLSSLLPPFFEFNSNRRRRRWQQRRLHPISRPNRGSRPAPTPPTLHSVQNHLHHPRSNGRK